MELETKYNEGVDVWVLNPKTGEAVKREIKGVRTQSVFGIKKTIYCFLKDWSIGKENPMVEDCFWLSEGKIFETKADLINNF